VEAIDNAEQSQIGVKLEGDRPEDGHTARQDSRPLGVCDGRHDQARRCDDSAIRHRSATACKIGDGSTPAGRIRCDFGKLLIVVFEHGRTPVSGARKRAPQAAEGSGSPPSECSDSEIK
jgi:hypothetical protein